MFIRVFIGVGLLSCLLPFSGFARDVAFDDLPELIQNQNKRAQSGESYLNSARSNKNHIVRSFLPKVSAYGGGETFKTQTQSKRTEPMAGLEARLNVFEGGRDVLEESIRRKKYGIQEALSKKTYLSELQRARDLYVYILYYKEIRGFAYRALDRIKKQLKAVNDRIQAGRTTEADRIDFQIEQSHLNQELSYIDEELEHGVELLQVTLDIPFDEDIHLTGKLSHIHDDPLFQKGFNSNEHLDVKMLEKEAKAADLEKIKSNLWWSPSIDVYGSYKVHTFREREQNSIDDRDEVVGGVQLTMNFFDGLVSNSKARSMKHKARGIKLEAGHRKRELEAEHRKLKHTLKLRHDMVHEVRRMVGKTKKYYQLVSQEYERGNKSSSDILSASQRIFDQRKRYAEVRRDYLITKNELHNFLSE